CPQKPRPEFARDPNFGIPRRSRPGPLRSHSRAPNIRRPANTLSRRSFDKHRRTEPNLSPPRGPLPVRSQDSARPDWKRRRGSISPHLPVDKVGGNNPAATAKSPTDWRGGPIRPRRSDSKGEEIVGAWR